MLPFPSHLWEKLVSCRSGTEARSKRKRTVDDGAARMERCIGYSEIRERVVKVHVDVSSRCSKTI